MGGLWFFIFLTIIYSVIRYKVTERKSSIIWGIAYLCVLVIGMFYTNLALTKKMCGSPQTGTAIMVTTIPWAVVFGLLGLMLLVFPGWLSPFSNTIGYLFAKLAGVGTLMDKIIAPKDVTTDTAGTTKAAAEALEQIYSDKSLIVNQLTEENFGGFWSKMSSAGLFNKGADAYKTALLNVVRLKNVVAELVWALLSGGLAISISNSYILGTACEKSAKEMMRRHNQYESDSTKKMDEVKAPRVYTKM
jgi:hypothetical protein